MVARSTVRVVSDRDEKMDVLLSKTSTALGDGSAVEKNSLIFEKAQISEL
jgi:hypothetical protein